ncbi:MAG: Tad domain-containing protein [Elusimicrobiota bacterium]|nr:Tad domain-containing protein [Elusimicrobiota bacterium]
MVNRVAGNAMWRGRESGQAMPFFVLCMIMLLLFWMTIINVGKLVKDRMVMQNSVDNAAISLAIHQARVMNMVNKINEMIAKVFYDSIPIGPTIGMGGMHPLGISGVGGGVYGVCGLAPLLPQLIKDDVSRVGATIDIIPLGMTKCSCGTGNGSSDLKTGVQAIKAQIDALIPIQEAIAKLGPMASVVIAREIAKRQELNLAGETTAADEIVYLPLSAIHLKRNKQKITYFYAKHIYISIPPCIPIPPGLHLHIVMPKKHAETEKSWYYADKDSFYKKKFTVTAFKKKGSASNKGYPFGQKLFPGLEWPAIQTIASAGFYNAGGPGFVLKKSPYKGVKIKENIKAFEDGYGKGWEAHLVPVGSGFQH